MENKLRSIPELLKDSWALFTKVWKKYLIIYLVMVVGFFLLFAVILGTSIGSVGLQLVGPNSQEALNEILTRSWPLLLIGFILLVLFGSVVALTTNKVIFSEGEGKPITVLDGFKYALGNFMYYFFVSFVQGILIVLGFVLFVIPGIYALTVLSFVPVVFVIEEKHNLSVLTRSRDLVKGRFWPVFGRLLVLAIIAIIVSNLTSSGDSTILSIISFVVSFIFSVISINYVYFLYKDLVARQQIEQ